MLIQKVLSIVLALTISSIPVFASASVEIMNNTNQNSTASINNGICSSNSALGESGITRPHSSNTITDFVIWYACHATPTHCTADVYMTTNCGSTGEPKVATVVFDSQTGIKSIQMYSNKYVFTHGDFSVQLNNAPGYLAENDSDEMMW